LIKLVQQSIHCSWSDAGKAFVNRIIELLQGNIVADTQTVFLSEILLCLGLFHFHCDAYCVFEQLNGYVL